MTPGADVSSRPDAPAPGPRPPGTVALGVILVGIGVAVAIDWSGMVSVSWHLLLPLALVAVGVGHLAGARRDRHAGLTTLGITLTLLLAVSDVVDIPFADRLTSSDNPIEASMPLGPDGAEP